MIIDSPLLAKLDHLSFATRRVRAGQSAGERRSTKRGTSVEFADYRNYARGDDLRRVDWNIYARLERPFVKLFEEEEDLAVHLLLDSSQSMDWGDGETNKWHYTRRLAGALSYIALGSGDRLSVNAIGPMQFASFGPVRSRGHTLRLFEWLERLETGGTTNLNGTLQAYALQGGRAGLVILVSDLFSPAGYVDGLTSLAARGHEVVILHLLSPDEVEPPLGGDLRLVDVETEDTQEVTIDIGMLNLYRRRLEAWQTDIRTTCRGRDAHYVPVTTNTPLEQIILSDLRRAGVIS